VRWLSRLVTFGLMAVVIVVVVVALKDKVGRRKVGQGRHTYVMLRDASALPIGSRVMIAGVQVGEIEKLSIQGGLARVDLRLRDDVILWDDASAEKRSASLFGDAYLEIRPGGAEVAERPAEPGGFPGGHRQLGPGEPIPHAIEAASTDRVLLTDSPGDKTAATSAVLAQPISLDANTAVPAFSLPHHTALLLPSPPSSRPTTCKLADRGGGAAREAVTSAAATMTAATIDRPSATLSRRALVRAPSACARRMSSGDRGSKRTDNGICTHTVAQ